MAGSVNKVILVGNATRDPEVKTIGSGSQVANFGMATNRSWKDASGQKQEKVEFHNLVAWGKLADIIGQYVTKGMKLYVEGRLETREWEGQDGGKRKSTEVIVEEMVMLGSKPQGGQERESRPAKSYEAPTPRRAPSDEEEIRVEDIPF
jgi:single-strand DNA-binding protein